MNFRNIDINEVSFVECEKKFQEFNQLVILENDSKINVY